MAAGLMDGWTDGLMDGCIPAKAAARKGRVAGLDVMEGRGGRGRLNE